MNNEEIIIIICGKRENKLSHLEVNCFKCNDIVTMSDSSIQAVKEQFPERDLIKYPPQPICIECYMKIHKKEDEIAPLTNNQIKEIIENI